MYTRAEIVRNFQGQAYEHAGGMVAQVLMSRYPELGKACTGEQVAALARRLLPTTEFSNKVNFRVVRSAYDIIKFVPKPQVGYYRPGSGSERKYIMGGRMPWTGPLCSRLLLGPEDTGYRELHKLSDFILMVTVAATTEAALRYAEYMAHGELKGYFDVADIFMRVCPDDRNVHTMPPETPHIAPPPPPPGLYGKDPRVAG